MVTKINIRDFQQKDIDELIYHLAVQTLLDIKAIYGQITKLDIDEATRLAIVSKTILFGNRIAAIVVGVPSENKESLNLFLYATTEGFSKLDMLKEAMFSVINSLQKNKICSIVYKGNKKLQSILRASGLKFKRSVCFGKENRQFYLYVKE